MLSTGWILCRLYSTREMNSQRHTRRLHSLHSSFAFDIRSRWLGLVAYVVWSDSNHQVIRASLQPAFRQWRPRGAHVYCLANGDRCWCAFGQRRDHSAWRTDDEPCGLRCGNQWGEANLWRKRRRRLLLGWLQSRGPVWPVRHISCGAWVVGASALVESYVVCGISLVWPTCSAVRLSVCLSVCPCVSVANTLCAIAAAVD